MGFVNAENAVLCPIFWVPTKWRRCLGKTLEGVMPMAKAFSFSMWVIGKIFALKGFAITSIVFELVSKVSGRGQYKMRDVFLIKPKGLAINDKQEN